MEIEKMNTLILKLLLITFFLLSSAKYFLNFCMKDSEPDRR